MWGGGGNKISQSDTSATKQSRAQGYALIHLFLKQESVLALCRLSAGNTGQVSGQQFIRAR